MHLKITLILIFLISNIGYSENEELMKQYKKLYELNEKARYSPKANKELNKFMDEMPIVELARIICMQKYGRVLDGALGVSLFMSFSKKLFLKELNKLSEVDSIFREYHINLVHLLRLGYASKYSNQLKNFALNAKKEKNEIDLLTSKRFIVGILLEISESELFDYCKNRNLETCFKEGEWAFYDNDIETAYQVDQTKFKIKLFNNDPDYIFNGNGKSKESYYEYQRIKKLSGKTKEGKLVEIEIPDTYGWHKLILPKWVWDESIEFKIKETYPGSLYQTLYISEIKQNFQINDDRNKWYNLLSKLRIDESQKAQEE